MKRLSQRCISLLLVLAAVVLQGCAHQARTAVRLNGQTIVFNGPITPAAAAEFTALAAHHPVRRLLIDSGGGDVEAAIGMASVVFKQGLDVEVTQTCFSSCANYIFPAGKRKLISGLGLVGWHGTMAHRVHIHHTGLRPVGAQELELLARQAALERRFYQSIGVDGFIAWFGKLPPYDAWNLYILSKHDMALFGLTGIEVREDYLLTDLSYFDKDGKPGVRPLVVDALRLEAMRPPTP